MPELTWDRAANDKAITLHITASKQPEGARLWVAHSGTKDFRQAKWESQPLAADANGFVGEVARPSDGHVAHYGELQYQINGVAYSLCTLIQRD